MDPNDKLVCKEVATPNGYILVVTDPQILGKKYENEKLQLDLTKDFYKGEQISVEEIIKKTKKAYLIHFTGKKSVEIGTTLGVVDNNKILTIDNVPHAEVYLG